ncbi:MAG: hypothetical protein SNJ79_02315 [Sphingomonadaceae bacterium]
MRHSTRRDEPGFYNFLTLSRAKLDDPTPTAGLPGALMSHDPRTEARTSLVEIPAGWQGRFDAREASFELFLLRGDLALEGNRVGASGYVHVPQACGGGELDSVAGALALAFWNPNLPAFPYPYTRNRTLKTWEQPWTDSVPGSHGVRHKSLRLPDPTPQPGQEGMDGGPGGYLRFQYIEPGMIAADEHVHHECFEEILLLAGDCFLLNEGQMGLGSVVVHPQEWYHAPFVSRSGAIILVHTDAPMGFPWPPRPYPKGAERAAEWLDTTAWDQPTAHMPWADHPMAAAQEADPAYIAWRKTGEGRNLWGDSDTGAEVPFMPGGRDTASRFRASWTRKDKS